MNKRNHRKIIHCVLIPIVCLWHVLMQLPPAQAAQTPSVAIGRDNPFAEIPKPKKPEVTSLSPDFSRPTTETPELFVETVTLKFLGAENLKKAIENMSSEYGSMATNPKSNSLIICDTKERLVRILAEIKKADRTPQQVMVEVVIVDVQLGDDTEIGVNWDILSDKNYDIAYRQNFTSRLTSTIEDADTIGNATAFVTRGLGGDFSVISGTIRNVLHLIQQRREAEVLASPRVMLVSGQTASIEAVEELPYTEVRDTAGAGAAALTSTEFKLVGVQLHVGATLTDSNDILLTVDATQNVATGQSDTEIPIVDTRKAKTSLLLRDGQVVILGGLRRQEKTKEVDQIPFISQVPLIGELFKSTNTVVKNSELIIFLSPHIYKGEPIPEDAMEKFREISQRPLLSLPSTRDSTKQQLLKKIRTLQEEGEENADQELLATLASLEKLLRQELKEALDASEAALAESGT